jgi:hypothetical protein
MAWYTIRGAGGGPKPAPGPYRTIAEAEEAIERFRERHGDAAGTHLAAGSVRILEYATRTKAREGDISDGAAQILRAVR